MFTCTKAYIKRLSVGRKDIAFIERKNIRVKLLPVPRVLFQAHHSISLCAIVYFHWLYSFFINPVLLVNVRSRPRECIQIISTDEYQNTSHETYIIVEEINVFQSGQPFDWNSIHNLTRFKVKCESKTNFSGDVFQYLLDHFTLWNTAHILQYVVKMFYYRKKLWYCKINNCEICDPCNTIN